MSKIIGIEALEYGDFASGKAPLSIKELGIIEMLSSQLDTFSYLRNNEVVKAINTDGVGSVVFRKFAPVIAQEFVVGNLNYDLQKSDVVNVDLDKFVSHCYYLQNIDDVRTIESYELSANSTKLLSLRKVLNALFIGYAINQVKDNKTLVLSKIGDASATNDEIKSDWKQVKATIRSLCKTYDNETFGTDFTNYRLILSVDAYDNVLELLDSRETALGDALITQGKLASEQNFKGIRFNLDDMLQNKIDANQSFAKGIDFDFSKIVGFGTHLNSICFPFKEVKTAQGVEKETGRDWVLDTYAFGLKVLLPKKMFVIVSDKSASMEITRTNTPAADSYIINYRKA